MSAELPGLDLGAFATWYAAARPDQLAPDTSPSPGG